MDVDIIISSIKDNPIYLTLTIILFGLCIFALVKSLYKIFIILLCITLVYFFYLDMNNDPDYEKAKKEVKEDINSTKFNIPSLEETKDNIEKTKDKAEDFFDKNDKKDGDE